MTIRESLLTVVENPGPSLDELSVTKYWTVLFQL